MAHYRMATCATSRPYGFAAIGYDDPPRRCHQGRAAAIDRAYRGRWIAAAAVQVKLQVPPVGHQGPRQSHSLIMGTFGKSVPASTQLFQAAAVQPTKCTPVAPARRTLVRCIGLRLRRLQVH
jgi:hypothetical protein